MTQRSGSKSSGKARAETKTASASAPKDKRLNPQTKAVKHRINPRAVLGLTVLFVALIGGIVGVFAARAGRGDAALLLQAKEQLKNKKLDTALNYLGAYLERRPNDLEALDLRAQILADTAHDGKELLDAAAAYDLLVRRAPDDPKSQDRRARLVELYVETRRYINQREVRYRTAEAVARDYFAIEAKRPRTAPVVPERDAKVHRLLGQILVGEALLGDLKAITGRKLSGGKTETGAIDEFRAALKLQPTNVENAELFAALLVDPKLSPDPKAGKVEAQAVMDRLVEAEKAVGKVTPATRLTRFRFFNLLAAGNPEKLKLARAELAEARKIAPKNLDVLLASAESALAAKDFVEARKILDSVPAKHRDDLVFREFEGRLEVDRFHPELAAENWRKALVSVGGVNAELTFLVAYFELQLNRVAEAEPLIAQLARILESKDAPEVQCLRALREIKLRRPAKAVTILEKLRLTLSSYEPNLQNRISSVLGQAYEALGDRQKALEQYHIAASLAPTVPSFRIQAARVALLDGDDRGYDQAVEELRRGLNDMPDEPLLLLQLLEVEMARQIRRPPDRRSWNEFERLLDRAVKVVPTAPTLVGIQADYLAATGKLDQAVSQAAAAVKHDRKDPELWRVWANGLSRQGKLDEAERVLERALAAENAGDQAALRIQLARVLTLQGRGREASERLTRRWQTLPPDQRLTVWKAAVDLARDRGQASELRRALVQWAELDPGNPQPALTLLDTALADNDRDALKTATGLIAKLPAYQSVYSSIARLQEILRDPDGIASGDRAGRAARIAEADKLVLQIQNKTPGLWVGYAQEGLLRELENKPEEALRAYRQARKLGGTNSIIGRMVLLLVRFKRLDELAELRRSFADNPVVDRLAADTSLMLGERDQAEALAAQVVAGEPDGLDVRQWQARVLGNLGESEKAAATLSDFVSRHPGQPAALLSLLQFQILLRRPAEEIDKTLKLIDETIQTDHPEFFRAQAHRIAGDRKEAERLFRLSLAKWPDDPAVALGTADFLYSVLHLADEAEAVFRDRLRRDPTETVSARGLAIVLASRLDNPKDLSAAWDLIKPGAPGSGNSPNDRYVRAEILSHDLNRRAEAIQELESLLADLPIDRPEAVNGRDLLFRLYRLDGRVDKMLEVFRVAANSPGKTDAEAIYRYVLALLEAGKPAEAARQLDRLVELQPNALRVDLLRARILKNQGKIDEAASVLTNAYERRADEPNFRAVGQDVVNPLRDFGRYDEAEKIVQDLVKRDSTLVWLSASIAASRGRYAEALASSQAALDAGATADAVNTAVFTATKAARAVPPDTEAAARAIAFIEKAQAKYPDNVEAILALAHARYFQGRYEDQVRLYRLALDKKPARFDFLNSLAYILCERLNQPSEALERINECIAQGGPSSNILDTKGLILIRLKQYDAAIRILNEALRVDAGTALGMIEFHLALAEREAGHPEASKQAAARAKKAGLDLTDCSERERREWEELSK